MENEYENEHKLKFLKTDDNKIINERCIRWVKKISDCLEVCTRSNGCAANYNTHRICKTYNAESYDRLNKHFD